MSKVNRPRHYNTVNTSNYDFELFVLLLLLLPPPLLLKRYVKCNKYTDTETTKRAYSWTSSPSPQSACEAAQGKSQIAAPEHLKHRSVGSGYDYYSLTIHSISLASKNSRTNYHIGLHQTGCASLKTSYVT